MLGYETVAQLAAADPELLARWFGPTTGPRLVHLAGGQDDSPVVGAPYQARSLGREVTYQQDLEDWAKVRREVARLARLVSEELTEAGRPVLRVVAAAVEAAALAALAALDAFTEVRPARLPASGPSSALRHDEFCGPGPCTSSTTRSSRSLRDAADPGEGRQPHDEDDLRHTRAAVATTAGRRAAVVSQSHGSRGISGSDTRRA